MTKAHKKKYAEMENVKTMKERALLKEKKIKISTESNLEDNDQISADVKQSKKDKKDKKKRKQSKKSDEIVETEDTPVEEKKLTRKKRKALKKTSVLDVDEEAAFDIDRDEKESENEIESPKETKKSRKLKKVKTEDEETKEKVVDDERPVEENKLTRKKQKALKKNSVSDVDEEAAFDIDRDEKESENEIESPKESKKPSRKLKKVKTADEESTDKVVDDKRKSRKQQKALKKNTVLDIDEEAALNVDEDEAESDVDHETQIASPNGHQGDKQKLPIAYKSSSRILWDISKNKTSLRAALDKLDPQVHNIPKLYLMVNTVLSNLPKIREVAKKCNLNKKVKINEYLLDVLLSDFLFGKKFKDLDSNIKEISLLKPFINDIKKVYHQITKRLTNQNKLDKLTSWDINYLRVNNIKSSMNEMLDALKLVKFEMVEYSKDEVSFKEFTELVLQMKSQQIIIDWHFPKDMIVVLNSSKRRIINLKEYKEGHCIFQDKASLLAVEAMKLKKNMRVLDIAAAPGTKTATIASWCKNQINITSMDMDETRVSSMRKLMDQLGVNCTEIRNEDFIGAKFDEKREIDVLLLDPSCSGSGMHKRIDYNPTSGKNKESEGDKSRNYKLAAFQTKMLCKAMSLNPKRIVYSTCSTDVLENEFVVSKSMQESPDAEKYSVIAALPDWEERGRPGFDVSEKCVRSSAANLTNGFFVAVLKRNDK